MKAEEDRFIKASEAAELLATTIHTLTYWRMLGKGPPFYKPGGRAVRYLRSEVMAWGKSQKASRRQ